MFLSLFFKECKLNLKSITYYILCICIIGFLMDQVVGINLKKPQPNDEYYVSVIATDKTQIMQSTIHELKYEYEENRYATYPFGFIKPVTLNEENKNKVKDIIDEVSKEDKNEDYYDEFLAKMDSIDKLLGGTSFYSLDSISHTRVPGTYEQSLEKYNSILYEDHVSDAYARVFCDYSGIIMGIMPVFLAVAVCLRDKKSKAEQIIYSSKISAPSIIIARYLSVIVMLMVPIVILAFLRDSECIYYAKSVGIEPNYFSFSKYILGWLMPTVMVSAAVGFFFTELLQGVGGIFIQLLLWFVGMCSNRNILGGVKLHFVPRFNIVGDRDVYLSVYNELVVNRIMYFSISVILIIFTIIIFNLRRSGRLKVNGKLLPSFKG